MKDLHILLSGNAKAAKSTGPEEARLYKSVNYLMPLGQATKELNLKQSPASKNTVECPGFPRNSLFYIAYDGSFEGHYNRLYIVVDKADQVVAVQLVDETPNQHDASNDLNRYPPLGGTGLTRGEFHTYNFINSHSKSLNSLRITHSVFPENTYQFDTLRIDSQVYEGRKCLEAVRLYLPKSLVELILYCIDKSGIKD